MVSFFSAEFDFYVVNESMALDLTFSILCELLQQWEQTSAGVLVLLEWLLGKEDIKDLEAAALVMLLTSVLFTVRSVWVLSAVYSHHCRICITSQT